VRLRGVARPVDRLILCSDKFAASGMVGARCDGYRVCCNSVGGNRPAGHLGARLLLSSSSLPCRGATLSAKRFVTQCGHRCRIPDSAQHTGTIVSPLANREACRGSSRSVYAPRLEELLRCHGDQIAVDPTVDWYPNGATDFSGSATFTGGTGKYEGITGGFKEVCHNVFSGLPPITPSIPAAPMKETTNRRSGSRARHSGKEESMVNEEKLNQFIGQILDDPGGAATIATVRMGGAASLPIVRIGDALGLYQSPSRTA
jgi:hypothetical protein